LFGWTNIPMEWISALLLISIPVYIVIAMKRFYEQSWGKVVVKFVGISFTYNIVFWIAVILVFLNALSIV